jgi:DNA-binding CsgD family transcriptional regulator
LGKVEGAKMTSASSQASDISFSRNELLAEIHGLKTSFEAFKFLKKVAGQLGYDSFTVMGLPQFGEDLRSKQLVNNWNPELTQAYDEYKLAGESPVLKRLRRSVLPFTWDVVGINASRPDHERELAIDLFTTFDMTDGIYVPVYSPGAPASAVGFSGKNVKIAERDMDALHLIAMAACEKLHAINMDTVTVGPQLSERERECLLWTASGKTSSEIGEIINLSEHTVNHYIGTATTKLDAVSRPQAVAKAMRLGLIA